MKITKEQFRSAIGSILAQIERDEQIAKALEVICGEMVCFAGCDFAIDGMIALLEDLTADDFEWIKYWIYDLEHGKRKLVSLDESGKKIKLKTIGQLYDRLQKEWKEQGNDDR
jgi:hypothetical protein